MNKKENNIFYGGKIMRKNSKRIVASIAALGLISTGGVFAMPTVEEEVPVNISAEEIVELDEEKKAAMVSNLLVVLCADEPAQPVINSGTLNH